MLIYSFCVACYILLCRFCHVEFISNSEAKSAVKVFNGYEMDDNKLVVQLASPRPPLKEGGASTERQIYTASRPESK